MRRVRDRRRRASARHGSRARAAAVVARSGDVERGVGGVLRPAGRADRAASHDARVRQHAPHGRTGRAPFERSPRRRGGHGAPRQPVEGEAARRRSAAQERTAEGAGRHRLARARHRHRPRRSGVSDRLAPPDRHAHSAHRPIGAHRVRRAEGAALPDLARRSDRIGGAAAGDPARRSRPDRGARLAARRAHPAGRGRNGLSRVRGR